jgi:hypothetical protein
MGKSKSSYLRILAIFIFPHTESFEMCVPRVGVILMVQSLWAGRHMKAEEYGHWASNHVKSEEDGQADT